MEHGKKGRKRRKKEKELFSPLSFPLISLTFPTIPRHCSLTKMFRALWCFSISGAYVSGDIVYII
jgi:hypothetical protein